jgi:hypothetical protein
MGVKGGIVIILRTVEFKSTGSENCGACGEVM